MSRPLSQNMLQWLADLAAGRDPMQRKHGAAQRGGSGQVMPALYRRGFVDQTGAITDAGRAALAQASRPKLMGVRYMGAAQARLDEFVAESLGKVDPNAAP